MVESGNTFGSSSHTVIDLLSKWYKRHTGGSPYPAAFEVGFAGLGLDSGASPE
jgi:hypothetical protein